MAVPRAHHLFCCSSLQRWPLIVEPWPTHPTAASSLHHALAWCCYHANFVARAYMPVFVLQLAYRRPGLLWLDAAAAQGHDQSIKADPQRHGQLLSPPAATLPRGQGHQSQKDWLGTNFSQGCSSISINFATFPLSPQRSIPASWSECG